MPEEDQQPPGLQRLLGRLVRTGLGALHNRAELLAVEWEEERARLTELLFWAMGLVVLAAMGVILLTATISSFFSGVPAYVTAGFAVLYLLGALAVWFTLKSALRREAFASSLDQINKDRVWFDSLR